MSTADVLCVLLPDRAVSEIIKFIAAFQCIIFFWNLTWFLENQMMLTIQAVIAILHCGVHLLSHTFHKSEKSLKFRENCKTNANQLHNLAANEQWRNKWMDVYAQIRQLLHMDAMLLPLSINIKMICSYKYILILFALFFFLAPGIWTLDFTYKYETKLKLKREKRPKWNWGMRYCAKLKAGRQV